MYVYKELYYNFEKNNICLMFYFLVYFYLFKNYNKVLLIYI